MQTYAYTYGMILDRVPAQLESQVASGQRKLTSIILITPKSMLKNDNPGQVEKVTVSFVFTCVGVSLHLSYCCLCVSFSLVLAHPCICLTVVCGASPPQP